MTCDIVFGDGTCAFAITPAKLGLPYNPVGVLHFLNRLPLNLVMEMFCTAEPIPAERTPRLGIVNDIVPAAMLEEHVCKVARLIATRSSEAIASFKAAARARRGDAAHAGNLRAHPWSAPERVFWRRLQ